MSFIQQMIDAVKLLPIGGPGVCNIALTNVCNAKCDFCNYARDKMYVQDRKWLDYEKLCEALEILYDRGIRYVTLVGGEPTMHPKIREIVAHAVKIGMRPTMVTNGSRLSPELLADLKKNGLKSLFISIDAASAKDHEENRGLPGVFDRIQAANEDCKRLKIKTVASVTINKLIQDFAELLNTLSELGFDAVNFAYPKRELNSPALSFSQSSSLISYSMDELTEALETVNSLKDDFSILNSHEAISEMIRFVRKEEQEYSCVAGYKYFYMDYNFDMYRCDFWATKMCSVFEFRDQPFMRDHCTACNSGCYRDASVLMHSAVSVGDAIQDFRNGKVGRAMRHLKKPTNFRSIKTLVQDWATIQKLAKTHTATDQKEPV